MEQTLLAPILYRRSANGSIGTKVEPMHRLRRIEPKGLW